MSKKNVDVKTALNDLISKLPDGKEIFRLCSLKRQCSKSQIFIECREALIDQIIFGRRFCVCDEIARIYLKIKPKKQKFAIILDDDEKIHIPFMASRVKVHIKIMEAFRLSYKKVIHR